MENLFNQYKHIGLATVRKYYSHYLMNWEEDVIQTAYLGVYKAIKKMDIEKINNEVSFNSYIVWQVRGEIRNWEVSLFGKKDSARRDVEYNMMSLDYEIYDNESNKKTQADNLVDDYTEDLTIIRTDIKNALNKLNEEEKEIVYYIMSGRKLMDLVRVRGITKNQMQYQKRKTLEKLKILL